MSDTDNSVLTYNFHFAQPNSDDTHTFALNLDAITLDALIAPRANYPEWTALNLSQCPNCPLNIIEHAQCPVAANLVELIDFFKDSVSHEEIDLKVESVHRTYIKRTTMQDAISSMLGMLMVTAGCPIMDKLRPMLRAHIPFGTLEETTYRYLSMYMLAQYFLHQRGEKADMELTGLQALLEDIQVVNKHFWQRFASASVRDASINALIALDNLAQYAAFSIDIGVLEDTETLFNAYFNKS